MGTSYATATKPDGSKVTVTMVNGKTQTAGLPSGTVVHTAGGNYTISGGSGGNYTSAPSGGSASKPPSVPDQVYGGNQSPDNLMQGGGVPGVSYASPVIGDPNVTNKVEPIQTAPTSQDSDVQQYIQALADAHCTKEKPHYNPNLTQDDSDLDKVIF